MTESQKLLVEYLENGSESAFRELVTRYVNLVHSTALRLVEGDAHLAQDVTQTVFLHLSRNAHKLSHHVMLGGWLHRDTCYVAAKTMRCERRRRAREQQAAIMNASSDHSPANLEKLAPILDEAINQLSGEDRTAILLRFYEQLDFRSVGAALGTNEDAARMRVTRALAKLQSMLKRRGATISLAALGAALAGEVVSAAPAGLAASIAGTVLTSPISTGGTSVTLLKFLTMSKIKAAIISSIVIASVATPLLVQREAQARLRGQDESLRQQDAKLAQLTSDNEQLSNLLAQAKASRPVPDNQSHELLKLRSEVGKLKRTVQEMKSPRPDAPSSQEDQLASMKSKYAAQVSRIKDWLDANPSEKIPELQKIPNSTWIHAVDALGDEDDFVRAASNLRANAEMQVLGTLSAAARQARDNNGQFPTDFSQLTPYLKSPIDDAILQRYEIVPANSLVNELQPGGDWVITQKAPVNAELDLRDAYGLTESRFADERVTNRWTLSLQH